MRSRIMTLCIVKAESPAATAISNPVGKAKMEVCDRLIGEWQKLADYFDISSAERARFERGQEPHAGWEWLRARGRFDELADAASHIGREDLVPRLPERPR